MCVRVCECVLTSHVSRTVNYIVWKSRRPRNIYIYIYIGPTPTIITSRSRIDLAESRTRRTWGRRVYRYIRPHDDCAVRAYTAYTATSKTRDVSYELTNCFRLISPAIIRPARPSSGPPRHRPACVIHRGDAISTRVERRKRDLIKSKAPRRHEPCLRVDVISTRPREY